MKWSGYWDAMFDKYWTDYIVELVAIYIVTRQIVIIAKAGMLWCDFHQVFFFQLDSQCSVRHSVSCVGNKAINVITWKIFEVFCTEINKQI